MKEKNEKLNNLVRVSTYARAKGFSVQWVYQLAKLNAITIIEIDGVKFVKIKSGLLKNARL